MRRASAGARGYGSGFGSVGGFWRARCSRPKAHSTFRRGWNTAAHGPLAFSQTSPHIPQAFPACLGEIRSWVAPGKQGARETWKLRYFSWACLLGWVFANCATPGRIGHHRRRRRPGHCRGQLQRYSGLARVANVSRARATPRLAARPRRRAPLAARAPRHRAGSRGRSGTSSARSVAAACQPGRSRRPGRSSRPVSGRSSRQVRSARTTPGLIADARGSSVLFVSSVTTSRSRSTLTHSSNRALHAPHALPRDEAEHGEGEVLKREFHEAVVAELYSGCGENGEPGVPAPVHLARRICALGRWAGSGMRRMRTPTLRRSSARARRRRPARRISRL